MTPPAATAAARLRPAGYSPPRASPGAPVDDPQRTPQQSTKPALPQRIRRGRIAEGNGLLRPRARRISGPAADAPSTAAVRASAVVEQLPRFEVPRIELPKVDWSAFRLRRLRPSSATPRTLVGAVKAAPDHPLTGLLIATRTWIGIVAVLVAGLVFVQVKLLHINAGIGTNVQKISALQQSNAQLRSELSALGSDQRVVTQAQRMGFVEPPVGSTRFTSLHRGAAVRAAASIAAPTAGSPGTGLMSRSSGSQAAGSRSTGGPGAASG